VLRRLSGPSYRVGILSRIAKGAAMSIAAASTVMPTRHVHAPRRVFVPPEAVGLLHAVATACHDETAFHRWEEDARPLLWASLRRAGFDPAGCDDALTYLIERAYAAVRAGREIGCEAAWTAAVLESARRQRRRSYERDAALRRRLACTAPWSYEEPRPEEVREEFAAVANALPQRLSIAIHLRLRGVDRHERRLALSIEFAVGREQARKIDRQSVVRMRTALGRRAV
jgi:hypothetical protein